MIGSADLAQRVEDFVEEQQDFPFGNLGNVVHTLAGIISNPGILVGEACKNGWDNFLQVSCDLFLSEPSA